MKLEEKNTIEKTPLKASDSNTRYLEKENEVFFKPTVVNKILVLFLQIFLIGLWSVLFYDVFIKDLNMPDSFWFYTIYIFIGFILSVSFLIGYINYKTKRYFNIKTGKFTLSHKDFIKKEKKLDKILGIQIIGFQERRRIPAGNIGTMNALFTNFQLIIVMQNLKRYNIATFNNREKVFAVANKLSTFLQKPIFNEIGNFEGIDEKLNKLSKSFRSRFILKDNFEVSITKEELVERLVHENSYEIKWLNENLLVVDATKLGVFNSNLGSFINKYGLKPFEAYIQIEKRNNLLRVHMNTKFRYEFLIYISLVAITLAFGFFELATMILLVTILFWFFQRGDEKTFFHFLKINILKEDKDANILNK
ncbi:hypothetical protein QSV08_03055 [Maribacter sp. BPC-D8]|uniref:hypothetical protein n=1 Tax=Maribacter sp. BPC-D8 TaxID=3053613 RepID=UPI002B4647AD|nr:hypothetical protein [Maribacter sp. BPC-D8]WRI30222.1 hypothetical protein QSV08_03055 [Maribacter sp. BPC-D8]